MKIVLWRLAYNCLPTGQQLKKRHVPEAPDICYYCGREETLEHTFLICQYVAEIWRELKNGCGLSRRLHNCPSAKQWLFDYLAKSTEEEATILTITIWHIWEARNCVRNGEHEVHPCCIVQKIQAYVEMVLMHLYEPVDSKKCDPVIYKQWAPPPEGWVKVNVDTALFAESKKMDIGLVIRDHNGSFLAACRQSRNWVTEPELAEAIALIYAVHFVSSLPYHKVLLASDCLSVIQKLQSNGRDRSLVASVIQDIKQEMRLSSIDFSFIHVSRCCNVVAHVLARSAGQYSDSVWFHEAPELIRASLCNDRLN